MVAQGSDGSEQSTASFASGFVADTKRVVAIAGAAKTSAPATAKPAHNPRPKRSLLSTGAHLNTDTGGLSSTQKERTPTLNRESAPLRERGKSGRDLVGLVVEQA